MLDQAAPDFTIAATNHPKWSLADQRGKWVAIYFYPKDDTPGCTLEGADFRDAIDRFTSLGAVVAGVSRDSVASHDKFKCKMSFPFELLSDENETVCEAFGVMKLKNMYGKQVRGVERSTFLIDPQGVVRAEWRGVKVEGHVTEVLAKLRALSA